MGATNKLTKWKELDEKIEKGLKKTAEKLIANQKKKGGTLIIADKKGKIKEILATDL